MSIRVSITHRRLAAIYFVFLLNPVGFASIDSSKVGALTPYAKEMLSEKPFWESRSLKRKLKEDREILVSTIKTDKAMGWEMKGVGWVRASMDHTWKYVREFENLKKAPKHFKKVHFSKEDQTLIITLDLLGKEREIVAQVFPQEVSDKEYRMHWRNVRGLYQGLEGVLVLKKVDAHTTEVSQLSRYDGENLKAPAWVFRIVSESVMKHVASMLRRDVEKHYQVDQTQ